ncbi:MAG: hypothetical protein V1734_01565 [Nanoarchaeota archaeon]
MVGKGRKQRRRMGVIRPYEIRPYENGFAGVSAQGAETRNSELLPFKP